MKLNGGTGFRMKSGADVVSVDTHQLSDDVLALLQSNDSTAAYYIDPSDATRVKNVGSDKSLVALVVPEGVDGVAITPFWAADDAAPIAANSTYQLHLGRIQRASNFEERPARLASGDRVAFDKMCSGNAYSDLGATSPIGWFAGSTWDDSSGFFFDGLAAPTLSAGIGTPKQAALNLGTPKTIGSGNASQTLYVPNFGDDVGLIVFSIAGSGLTTAMPNAEWNAMVQWLRRR